MTDRHDVVGPRKHTRTRVRGCRNRGDGSNRPGRARGAEQRRPRSRVWVTGTIGRGGLRDPSGNAGCARRQGRRVDAEQEIEMNSSGGVGIIGVIVIVVVILLIVGVIKL